jgi:GH24 family phage-related lysozyme (muramidase)
MDLLDRTKCDNANTRPRVILNDNQFGALSSFVFNAGCDALTTSTLLTRLNNGEDPNTVAAQELPKFNKATLENGMVVVTARRAAEVTVFQTSSQIIVHPCI